MTGHRSVYPSQIAAAMKSSSIHGDLGKEIEKVQTEFVIRQHSLTSFILALVGRFLRRDRCKRK